MYFIGNNLWDQFGQEIKRRELVPCRWSNKIPRAIALGPSHALYLFDESDADSVIVSGRNNQGQCGIDNDFRKIETIESLPFTSSIRSIFTNHSSRHTFIQTNSDEIYAFGWNKYRQLGFDHDENGEEKVATPRKITPPCVVDTIATGYDHSLLLSNKGEVFVTKKEGNKKLWRKVFGLRPKITQIAVGEEHNILKDQYGKIWCFGKNNCGQLGSGGTDEEIHVRPDMIVLKGPAVDIATGRDHTLCLLQNGDIVSFGLNNYAQCGHENEKEHIVSPTKVNGLPAIDKVKTGYYHNAAIKTQDALEIFMFGHNVNGECIAAPEEEKIVVAPLSINEFVRRKTGGNLIDVILGVSCSIVLVEEDERKEAMDDDDDDDDNEEEERGEVIQEDNDDDEEEEEEEDDDDDEKQREAMEEEAHRRQLAEKARETALENEELRRELEGLREEFEAATVENTKDKEMKERLEEENKRLVEENERLRAELNKKSEEKEAAASESDEAPHKIADYVEYLNWDSDQITDWIINIDREQYEIYEHVLRVRLKQENIDGSVLSAIDKNDLQFFGITSIKHKLQIITKIRILCGIRNEIIIKQHKYSLYRK